MDETLFHWRSLMASNEAHQHEMAEAAKQERLVHLAQGRSQWAPKGAVLLLVIALVLLGGL